MKWIKSYNASTQLLTLSTSYAISSFYFVKVIENTSVSLLLTLYGIPYKWSLLTIKYLTRSTTYWNEGNTLVIYGITELLLLGMGIWLLSYLFKQQQLSWRKRFFITWLAFALINNAFSGIFTGSFVYDGFGYAFFWLLPSLLPRLTIAFLFFLLYIALSNFWSVLFLTTSYSSSLIQGRKNERKFLLIALFIPLGLLALVVVLFNFPNFNKYETLQAFYPLVYLLPILIFLPEPGRIKLASKGKLSVDVPVMLVLLTISVVALRLLNQISI